MRVWNSNNIGCCWNGYEVFGEECQVLLLWNSNKDFAVSGESHNGVELQKAFLPFVKNVGYCVE
jgi:hypothetical protein